jgi:hypothetical protein
MAAAPQFVLTEAEWQKYGLRLLVFARYWARVHYHWIDGRLLPTGKTPEDVVIEVLVAFSEGERQVTPDVPLLVQLKGAIRSALWNLHTLQEGKRTTSHDPVTLGHHLDAAPDPAAVAQSEDYWAAFFGSLLADARIAKRPDLIALVRAFSQGATSIEDVSGATGFPAARVSELKRKLKPIAEQISAQLRQDREST